MLLTALFGIAFIAAGWFQANYGHRPFQPDTRGWPYSAMRLWRRRFDRQVAMVTGVAIMMFGLVLLVGSAITALASPSN